MEPSSLSLHKRGALPSFLPDLGVLTSGKPRLDFQERGGGG